MKSAIENIKSAILAMLVLSIIGIICHGCGIKCSSDQHEKQVTEYENCMANKAGTILDMNACAEYAGLFEWVHEVKVYHQDTDNMIVADLTTGWLYSYWQDDVEQEVEIADIVINGDTTRVYGIIDYSDGLDADSAVDTALIITVIKDKLTERSW